MKHTFKMLDQFVPARWTPQLMADPSLILRSITAFLARRLACRAPALPVAFVWAQ
jgi:hypothetical protein